MIRIKGLYKAFDQNEVLKGIDLHLNSHKISAILGPNGSGKTTLIKCILGMVIPDGGSISVFEEEVKGKWKYRDQISYLPQIARFPENLRVRELIAMVKSLRNREANDRELLDLFDLEPVLDTRVSHLSGGTLQRINICLALMYDSPVIILDEPSTGLDPVALIELKRIIRSRQEAGRKVIITTHIMSLVESLADEIVFLLEGEIYFRGPVNDLKEMHHEQDLEAAIADILKNHQSRQK